jgi:alpha-aminoadipate carrier protein LysW
MRQHLTLHGRESKYKCGAAGGCKHLRPKKELEEGMVLCPECESDLDVEEDELDEGEIISCTECGSDFEVVSVGPLELTKVSDDDEDEEVKETDEDGDY